MTDRVERTSAKPNDRAGFTDAALWGEALSKRYSSSQGEVEALVDVNIAITPGRFITIVGPSGCGKSTLLMILAGLLSSSSGRVMYGDQELTGPHTDVGVVFQSPALLPWLSVLANTVLPGRVGRRAERRGSRELKQRGLELLNMVGLADFEDRYPNELSGGMQQRNAIARALLLDPPVLLMDEPFGALDALTRERMNEWLADIWQAQKKAVALVTHSIDEAVYLADEIVVMSPRPGRIIARVEVPLPRPRHPSLMKEAAFTNIAAEIRQILDESESNSTKYEVNSFFADVTTREVPNADT